MPHHRPTSKWRSALTVAALGFVVSAAPADAATQKLAPWGLDRIDQTSLPLNGSYNYTNTGEGVTVYVIDSGIHAAHSDLTGRVRSLYVAPGQLPGLDSRGHGTAIASIVGGKTYGVAKGVKLVDLNVLDKNGSGTTTQVVEAINRIITDHVSGPAVANLSLGSGVSNSVNDAVRRLVADGVTVVAAAGNEGVDACTTSPASEPKAITVAASNAKDGIPPWSNFGTCVDLIAPGVEIPVAAVQAGNVNATRTAYGGTSEAAAFVSGAAARILATYPKYTPAQVAAELKRRAVKDKITSVSSLLAYPAGTPNLLLQTRPKSSKCGIILMRTCLFGRR